MMTTKIHYSWDLKEDDKQDAGFGVLTLDFFDPEKQQEKMWQEKTGLTQETLSAAIETIIFMSEKPISLLKLKNAIDNDIPLRTLHEAIEELQKGYESKTHGIRLQEVAEGYQFRTKATYSRFVQNFFNAKTLSLSSNALEVLAIIAYRQPVSRTQIDNIRGVDSSHLVRALMDKRLVQLEGRSDELGRPSTFGTTLEFLEVFNLSSLADLPSEGELHDIATNQGVGAISDIKTIVGGDRTKFIYDEMEELEALSETIRDISPDTAFTRVLKEEKSKEHKALENKTAFELLEEYVAREQTVKENLKSIESEILTSVDEVSVVSLSDLQDLFAVSTGEDFMDQAAVSGAIDEVMSQKSSIELLSNELSSEEDEQWLEKRLQELDSKSEDIVKEFTRKPELEV